MVRHRVKGGRRRLKILLFGGTFDPPHMGHMALLRSALGEVQPDLALVVPAGLPPHKRASATDGALRFAMCSAFLKIDPRVKRLRFEIDRPGKSYTFDTVHYLRRRWPGCEVFLALGSDMLLSFTTWYKSDQLLGQVTLVAQSRSEAETAQMQPAVEQLRAAGGTVLFLHQPVVELSSTEIRERCAAGHDITPFVPPPALRVIRRHRLYTKPQGGTT